MGLGSRGKRSSLLRFRRLVNLVIIIGVFMSSPTLDNFAVSSGVLLNSPMPIPSTVESHSISTAEKLMRFFHEPFRVCFREGPFDFQVCLGDLLSWLKGTALGATIVKFGIAGKRVPDSFESQHLEIHIVS